MTPSLQAPSRPAPKSHPRVLAKSCSTLHGATPGSPTGLTVATPARGPSTIWPIQSLLAQVMTQAQGTGLVKVTSRNRPCTCGSPAGRRQEETTGNRVQVTGRRNGQPPKTSVQDSPALTAPFLGPADGARCRGLEQIHQGSGTHRPAVLGTRGPRVTGQEPRAVLAQDREPCLRWGEACGGRSVGGQVPWAGLGGCVPRVGAVCGVERFSSSRGPAWEWAAA